MTNNELAEKEYPMPEKIEEDGLNQMACEMQRAAFIRGLEWKGGGWISVKDKLPNNHQTVLCASDVKEDVFRDSYCYYKGEFRAYAYPHPEPSVTHWMPLPQPPKIN